MKTYRTLIYWEDLKDGRHPYKPGDVYPRDGYTPSPERIEELSTTHNKRGLQLIEEVKAPEKVTVPLENKLEEPKKEKADGKSTRTAKSRPRKTK